jgi:hypothetical protein
MITGASQGNKNNINLKGLPNKKFKNCLMKKP